MLARMQSNWNVHILLVKSESLSVMSDSLRPRGLLRKTVQLVKLSTHTPHNPAIWFLVIYSREMQTQCWHKTCRQMLRVAIFTINKNWKGEKKKAYCCFSVTKSCLTLCDPMDCSTPGFPVLHCLPEFAQTYVHWVSNAIQPSHPLLRPSPLALNLSQHQGLSQMSQLFASGDQSIVASALAFLSENFQGWFPRGLIGLISLLSKGLSWVFSSTTIQKHQFMGSQSSLWSNSHIHTWLLEKP